jgi:hypothetical protein
METSTVQTVLDLFPDSKIPCQVCQTPFNRRPRRHATCTSCCPCCRFVEKFRSWYAQWIGADR